MDVSEKIKYNREKAWEACRNSSKEREMAMNKLTYSDRCKTYTNAMLAFGERNQLIVAIEELSECQKGICKILRGGEDFRHLAEEIADATIMLEQIQLMFNINDCVCNFMDEKIKRLEDRVKWSKRTNET